MILESSVYINRSVNFNNKDVNFDKTGNAEVEAELGKFITENFPKKCWEKGNRPELKSAQSQKKEGDTEEVVKLKERIGTLERIVTQKDAEIAKAKNGEVVWKEQFEKLQLEKCVEKTEEIKLEHAEVDVKIPEGLKEYYDELKDMHYQKVKKFILDGELAIEDEIKDIKSQKDLVQFALDKLATK